MIQIFYIKNRDNIGYVKEKQLEIDIFLAI